MFRLEQPDNLCLVFDFGQAQTLHDVVLSKDFGFTLDLSREPFVGGVGLTIAAADAILSKHGEGVFVLT